MIETIKERLDNKLISIKQARRDDKYIDNIFYLEVEHRNDRYSVAISKDSDDLYICDVINDTTFDTYGLYTRSLEELLDRLFDEVE